MPSSKELAAETLRGPDGDRIYLSIIDYARKMARWHGWKTGKSLLDAASPESVVNDVIVKVLVGVRVWDPEKEPDFTNALKGMVRSDLGHLFEKAEVTRVEPIESVLPNGSERTAEDFRAGILDPEAEVLQSESANLKFAALNLLFDEVQAKNNPDLESVFLSLYEADSLNDVSRITGLAIKRVYTLRRDLERIATRITVARVVWEAQKGKK